MRQAGLARLLFAADTSAVFPAVSLVTPDSDNAALLVFNGAIRDCSRRICRLSKSSHVLSRLDLNQDLDHACGEDPIIPVMFAGRVVRSHPCGMLIRSAHGDPVTH